MLEIETAETCVEGAGQRLATSDEGAAPPTTITVILFILLGLLLLNVGLDNLLDIADLDENVLGLEIRMDDTALAMQVVQAKQDLLGDLFNQRHRDTAMVPSLDQTQQVLTKNLEYHADVNTVGTLVLEGVQ